MGYLGHCISFDVFYALFINLILFIQLYNIIGSISFLSLFDKSFKDISILLFNVLCCNNN